MKLSKTKFLAIVCLLLAGLLLIYMGSIKSREPLNYSIKDTSITVIDLSEKDNHLNIISILGILLISFATILTAHNFLYQPKVNSREKIKLTRQEDRIISFIKNGLMYKEIAIELSISPSTVKTHINNIYKKLGINSQFLLNWQVN